MIAPLKSLPPSHDDALPGPRHIGQLLTAVLARYGIVLTTEELAAIAPSPPKKTPLVFAKRISSHQVSRISSDRVRRRPPASAAPAHRNMVQLPLFTPVGRVASSSLAVR